MYAPPVYAAMQVKEELENIEGDDKAEEMEAIAERIHKKFNVKETPGST